MTRLLRIVLMALALWAVLVVVVVSWQWLIVHLSQETGTSNEASRAYAWWSGAAGCLGYVAVLGLAWRHLNCHQPGCFRLGTHRTPKGYHLCKVCVAKSEDDLDLHEINEDHQ